MDTSITTVDANGTVTNPGGGNSPSPQIVVCE
jgi:hypothetical protein